MQTFGCEGVVSVVRKRNPKQGLLVVIRGVEVTLESRMGKDFQILKVVNKVPNNVKKVSEML